jgi:hypothetical protein
MTSISKYQDAGCRMQDIKRSALILHLASRISLPTRLHDARNMSFQGELAKAQSAQHELSKVAATATAALTAIPVPNLVLRLLDHFGKYAFSRHESSQSVKRDQ